MPRGAGHSLMDTFVAFSVINIRAPNAFLTGTRSRYGQKNRTFRSCALSRRMQRPAQCRAYTLVRPSGPTSKVLKASRRISRAWPALSRIVQAVSQIGL